MKRRASQRVSGSKSDPIRSPKENLGRARREGELKSRRPNRSQSVPPVAKRDDDDERCKKCEFAKKQVRDLNFEELMRI
jgi:hypothetical protein